MKLAEAIEQIDEWEKVLTGNKNKYNKLIGIKLSDGSNLLITSEQIRSNEWGVSIGVSDPAFVSAVGTIVNKLSGENKPHLVAVEEEQK